MTSSTRQMWDLQFDIKDLEEKHRRSERALEVERKSNVVIRQLSAARAVALREALEMIREYDPAADLRHFEGLGVVVPQRDGAVGGG